MSTDQVDLFEFGETRGGVGRAGELAGRALLFIPLGGGMWELVDQPDPNDCSEPETSVWMATEAARAAFASWKIDWVPRDATQEFAGQRFTDLDPRVVWGRPR